ncbi:MAG: UDP-N-acetylmuramoyl-tripeptide--D-alanyl-D-alanine ligase [Bacteroidales bacterium]|jgi:UDP-N-acetylmuramoyl-tripeptide--D-alanyl-D-alanine ligase
MQDINLFYKKYFKPGNVCTDSRTIKPGDIFVALKGEKFNGTRFIKKALESGAATAVTDDASIAGKNIYPVGDTLLFLQNLATHHRKHSGFHVIGLTGTNGKTTTKELIRSVIEKKYSCKATMGNLNNHIGVPLTLLSIPSGTEYAIIEMGANHQGEIARLCQIALPDSGLITNIGMAHLEGFGGIDGVLKAKNELYSYLINNNNTIYLNGADEKLSRIIQTYKNKVIYNDPAGICSGEVIEDYPELKIKITYDQQHRFIVQTNLYGGYNLENILAAACIGVDLDIPFRDINKAIEDYVPANHRSQILKLGSNKIILDCYNANPTSMQQALMSFSRFKADKKLVILGSMKELGDHSQREHQKLLDLLEKYHFKECILIGNEFSAGRTGPFTFFASFDEFRNSFEPEKFNDYAILVKGSRANELERITGLFEN